jgi:hypothetical protein
MSGHKIMIIAVAVLALAIFRPTQGHSQTRPGPSISLSSIQGAWWSDCADPAAEFVVQGYDYFGDFSGRYKLVSTGDVLVFEQGLGDGHGTDVTHRPLSFRVIDARPGALVLRPIFGDPGAPDWHLKSCSSMPH